MTTATQNRLMALGLTKRQASSVTAEKIVDFLMPDEANVLIQEAKLQVDEMRDKLNSLYDAYTELSQDLLEIVKAQKEYGQLGDDKARDVVALYASLISLGVQKGVPPSAAVNSASYIVYAYLGGRAERDTDRADER